MSEQVSADLIGGFTGWSAEGLLAHAVREPEAATGLPGIGEPEPFELEEGMPLATDRRRP